MKVTFSNKVPHAEPLGRNEGPCNFVAGWNMPGYLPEMEPVFFEHFDDAKRFILNSMGEHEDDYATYGDEDTAEEISALRQDCNLESGPFSVLIDNVAYWVEVAEPGGVQ